MIRFLLVLFCICNIHYALAQESLTNKQIVKQLIKESIQNYSGSCACPYQRTKNGSKCGKRSAYSKVGGYEPLCYTGDVSENMIQKWRDVQKK